MKQQNVIAAWGMATELSALIEEIRDKHSQYGRPSVDQPAMLKRARYLADQLEQQLKASATSTGAA